MKKIVALLAVALTTSAASAQVRIKDITEIAGARSNQLVGFGLVVGLDGTGSRSTFTQQVAIDMLQRLGVAGQIFSQTPADAVLRSTSIASVMVVADIGPFARVGSRLDVTVSVMDDSRSLQGGTLIFTPLRGSDGEVYSTAQGPLSIGGFSVSGAGAGLQKNQLNAGRIPNGGVVEKEAPGTYLCRGRSRLLLRNPDFNTARLIAKAINIHFPLSATAMDAGSVDLDPCVDITKTPLQFLAEVGLLNVKPDSPARVVINERTGTVVIGGNVTISPTAVAQGNLFLRANTSFQVSQPNPLGGGNTTVTPRTQVGAFEGRNQLVALPAATTVADVAQALNALGVTPRDLISIFQALKQAGALNADLEIL
ncbi:flagellar basal body P-ring protein FlgI [Limnoglobus roseus]|uniref:Flagellar P-ring protein n=1 Tax=Limnoglobus roseus TaxID=2598579 RepID=A0A5C1A9K0_9BACT|nr:flagellar basal body P-ring protein FlgI [Limnoglobus roseus]QEL13794.1 flagellar basal body P-ring protein FlgI [Limnoglobus roseus]